MEEKNSKAAVVFTDEEFQAVTKHLIGNNVRLNPNLLIPQTCGKSDESEVRMMKHCILLLRTCEDTVERGADDAKSDRELRVHCLHERSVWWSTGRLHGSVQQQHRAPPHTPDDDQGDLDRHEELYRQQCQGLCIYWFSVCR